MLEMKESILSKYGKDFISQHIGDPLIGETYAAWRGDELSYTVNEYFLRGVKDEYEDDQIYYETYNPDEEDSQDIDHHDDSDQALDAADIWLRDRAISPEMTYQDVVNLSHALNYPSDSEPDSFSRWSKINKPVDMLPFGYWDSDKEIVTDPIYNYKPEIFVPIIMGIKKAKNMDDLNKVLQDTCQLQFDQEDVAMDYFKKKYNYLLRKERARAQKQ
jgi:hypothetical protein